MPPNLEVLCTGDELLGGAVSDTNTAMFARLLAPLGLQVKRTTVVGDAQADIAAALRELCARADVVLLCGGLGPTEDDRTAAAVAMVLGVPLTTDQEALSRLEARVSGLGRAVGPNNRRQANVPQGCTVLQSEVGTAPGFLVRCGGARVFVMPGVPAEAQWFVEHHVTAALREQSNGVVRKQTLRVVGLPESALDTLVAGLTDGVAGASLHFRTVFPENHLTIQVRGTEAAAVEDTLAGLVTHAHGRLGAAVVGDDGRSLPAVLRDILKARGQTLAAAESCTGGLLQKLVTDESGSSAVFLGGVVAYSNDVKTGLLGVPKATWMEHGAVSAPVAALMATGIREKLGSTYALAITGVAGPEGGTPQKPVGTVFVGLAGPNGVETRALLLHGDRERIRMSAAMGALMWLLQLLRA